MPCRCDEYDLPEDPARELCACRSLVRQMDVYARSHGVIWPVQIGHAVQHQVASLLRHKRDELRKDIAALHAEIADLPRGLKGAILTPLKRADLEARIKHLEALTDQQLLDGEK